MDVSALFPVLTYKPTYAPVAVACLPVVGQEVFRRVGKTNSFRQVAIFTINGKKYVAKTYSRPLGEIVWRDMQKAKDSYAVAARYLPVAPTLFVYGREPGRERYVIRVQEYCPRRLCDLSDAELRSPHFRDQVFKIITCAETMIREAGWLPDCFGHPARPADIPTWPSLRTSTNIMVTARDEVVFVDINYPQPWNQTANPMGRLALWGAVQRLNDFRRFVTEKPIIVP